MNSTFLEKPKYDALSYTLGSPDKTKLIWLDGIPVEVQENLYQALYRLRAESDRLLYTGAICIDQTDLDERRYQVGLMDYIYDRAQCVLV